MKEERDRQLVAANWHEMLGRRHANDGHVSWHLDALRQREGSTRAEHYSWAGISKKAEENNKKEVEGFHRNRFWFYFKMNTSLHFRRVLL